MTQADDAKAPMKSTEKITKRVLIVEDDDAVARYLGRTLRTANYDVVLAANGRDASLLIETRAFDAIVTDISMPFMSGIDLLKAIRQRRADVPVILVTGQPDVATATEAIEHGALRYLAKPIGPGALREVVAEAIRAREEARMRVSSLSGLGEKTV